MHAKAASSELTSHFLALIQLTQNPSHTGSTALGAGSGGEPSAPRGVVLSGILRAEAAGLSAGAAGLQPLRAAAARQWRRLEQPGRHPLAGEHHMVPRKRISSIHNSSLNFQEALTRKTLHAGSKPCAAPVQRCIEFGRLPPTGTGLPYLPSAELYSRRAFLTSIAKV